jgi:hypothetical protein
MAKSNFKLNVFAKKENIKNDGSNFINLFRKSRTILAGEQKACILDNMLGNPPATTAPTDEVVVFLSRKEDYFAFKSTVLFAMELELQNNFEDHDGPFVIIEELKTMF